MDALWPFWLVLAFCVVVGIAGLYVAHAGAQPLDEEPTLDVQNHIGDSRPVGFWEPLDPISRADWEEDEPFLQDGPPPYAHNLALPSGRSYHWRES